MKNDYFCNGNRLVALRNVPADHNKILQLVKVVL